MSYLSSALTRVRGEAASEAFHRATSSSTEVEGGGDPLSSREGGPRHARTLAQALGACHPGDMAEHSKPFSPVDEIERAWRDEVCRRLDALRSGAATLVDGEAALAAVRARIADRQKRYP